MSRFSSASATLETVLTKFAKIDQSEGIPDSGILERALSSLPTGVLSLSLGNSKGERWGESQKPLVVWRV